MTRKLHGTPVLVTTMAGLLALSTACAGSPNDNAATNSSAAGTTKPALKAIRTIAYGDPINADAQFKAIGDSFAKAAQAQGITVYRFDNNLNPSTELSNARLMVQKKPDAIVDWSAASGANTAVGKIFAQAKIPCVALNVAIPGCPLFNQVSSDLGASEGTLAAQAVSQRGWTAADTTMILVWAPAVGVDLNAQATYLYSNFAKQFPAMKQVEPADIPLSTTKLGDNAVFVDGGGVLQQTNTAVKQALQAIPAGRHVVIDVLNDDSGLGAKQALAAANRTADALIIGNAAAPEGLAELRTNPNWVMEGSVFFDLWPKCALAMVLAQADGQSLPALTEAPVYVLTKSNLDQYYSGNNATAAPTLAPADDYLKPYLDKVGGPLPAQ